MRLFTRIVVRASALALSTALAVPAVPLLAPLVATPAYARSAPESFADLAEKLLPGVVNISTTQTVAAR
ncbi:MAG TPA: serine protease, partial [Acetobacteraceae bacterium]